MVDIKFSSCFIAHFVLVLLFVVLCEIVCSSARRLLGGPGLDVGRAVGAKGEALGGAAEAAARADLPAAAAVDLFLKKKAF